MRHSARRRYNKKVARIGRKAEETGGNVPQKRGGKPVDGGEEPRE